MKRSLIVGCVLSMAIASFSEVASPSQVQMMLEAMRKDLANRVKVGQTDDGSCECKEGIKLKLKGDAAGAVRCWQKCAERGHVVAQVELADYYALGSDVDHNWQVAAKLYLKAAEQGNYHATFMVGYCYLFGKGFEKDEVEAVKWLRKSADKGTPNAQYLLAFCYADGRGIRKDPEQFISWLRKAAMNEPSAELAFLSTLTGVDTQIHDELIPNAQFRLGDCYENGLAVSRDQNEARKWYQKAANGGCKEAKEALARLEASKAYSGIPDERGNPRPGQSRMITLPGGATIEMVWCPPGEFMMGSQEYGPVHRVRITKGFWLGKYEVTQKQWKSVMDENPSGFSGIDRLPVDSIFWFRAKEFCDKVDSALHCGARLPTEAEWEYACRAGTATQYNVGDDLKEGMANCRFAPNFPVEAKSTLPVGSFKANNWGLHDMHGNVMEWCSDEWDYNYYTVSPLENPQGPKSDSQNHVIRGGGYDSSKSECSSAYRAMNGPMRKMRSNFGMRLCCDRIP